MNQYRDLLGVPWVDGGRDPATGLDCIGVMLTALHRSGFRTPDPQVRAGQSSCADDVWRWFDAIRLIDARPGDVLRVWARRVPGGPLEHHVGVLDDDGLVLSSTASGVALVPAAVFVRLGLIGVYRPRGEPRP